MCKTQIHPGLKSGIDVRKENLRMDIQGKTSWLKQRDAARIVLEEFDDEELSFFYDGSECRPPLKKSEVKEVIEGLAIPSQYQISRWEEVDSGSDNEFVGHSYSQCTNCSRRGDASSGMFPPNCFKTVREGGVKAKAKLCWQCKQPWDQESHSEFRRLELWGKRIQAARRRLRGHDHIQPETYAERGVRKNRELEEEQKRETEAALKKGTSMKRFES